MEKKELKTSEQWQEKVKDKLIVLDPDGWDRQNFDKSWKEEKITLKEFKKRCIRSTCRFFDAKFLK
ncbi:MAG: hypothetical protein AABW59_03115 [archaeon]